MNILFCVEFYCPSVGGAQEVVRQLAERMASRGHTVSVATSYIAHRDFDSFKGVKIVSFPISGNNVRGMQGDVKQYQDFLKQGDFDVILFYAAQQWTFDAAWPVLPTIKARKVLVPCGYSGLLAPIYQEYFESLPSILRMMDALVYHAEDYRDVNFGKAKDIGNGVLIPNGADSEEFSVAKNTDFRQRISADSSTFVILTVGTMTGLKGHLELTKAFFAADFGDRRAILILNGNQPEIKGRRSNILRSLAMLVREYGWIYCTRHAVKMFLIRCGFWVGKSDMLQDWVERINREQGRSKRVLVTDYPRDILIQAYFNADLFAFASNIEYSPLVLFEACAAGLPFVSVPAGNSAEIARWTGGGEICEAEADELGYTRVSPEILAKHLAALAADPDKLARLGRSGYEASGRRYNWASIALEYENLFLRLVKGTPETAVEITPEAGGLFRE